ncbi:MAG: NERD domain-containing protein [Anaerolineae bacterium]|nr:NERD domain-containing protein [Anaerolineae bacterium]
MQIVRNERHIRVRSFIGKNMPLVGLGALAVGLIISFVKPEQLLGMAVSMLLGIIFSVIGGAFAERYAGPLAHHKVLNDVLKGLGGEYSLVQYLLPVPHVLLEPGGLTVLVIKSHPGQVTFQERGRWKHKQPGKFFRQLVGQEGVGAPDLEAEYQVEKLKRWLAGQIPDIEVPVRAAIVFVNPNVQLDAADSPIPAFYGKKIKAWLRGPGKLRSLPPAVYRQLVDVLGVANGDDDDDV